jgi:hypothetical protein
LEVCIKFIFIAIYFVFKTTPAAHSTAALCASEISDTHKQECLDTHGKQIP